MRQGILITVAALMLAVVAAGGPAQRHTAEVEGGKVPGGPVGRADIDPRRTLETQRIQEVES
jgi:hypothetical protein